MSDDDFSLSLETFKFFVFNLRNLALWLPALGLAVLLRVITHKWEHQLIFPICQCLLDAPLAFRLILTCTPWQTSVSYQLSSTLLWRQLVLILVTCAAVGGCSTWGLRGTLGITSILCSVSAVVHQRFYFGLSPSRLSCCELGCVWRGVANTICLVSITQ